MSFLDKIFHSLKGAANDALDNHQNLGASARQDVRELESQIAKAESALIDVRAQAELLKGKQATGTMEVAKWLKAATNAAGKDDALARECLSKKAAASVALAALETEIAKFQPTVLAIEEHIAKLRKQQESLSTQADLIGVRSEVADVEMRAAEIIGGINGSGVSLAATEIALAKKEARAHATTAVLNDKTGSSLEDRVAALNAGPSIEDELAALKSAK